MLRVPFVDFLTSMTQPELPLTVHEYGEWGDPADPAVLKKARARQLRHAECLTVFADQHAVQWTSFHLQSLLLAWWSTPKHAAFGLCCEVDHHEIVFMIQLKL